MKRILCIFLSLLIILTTACGKKKTEVRVPSVNVSGESENSAEGGTVEEITPPTLDLDFSKKDDDASYEESDAVKITFSDQSIAVEGEGAVANGTKLAINSAGTYVLSGNCQNGKITVNLSKNDKVKLVLAGLSLICKDGAALVVAEGDKVFLTLAEGS